MYKLPAASLLALVLAASLALPGGGNRVLYAADGELPPGKRFLEDMAAQAGIY